MSLYPRIAFSTQFCRLKPGAVLAVLIAAFTASAGTRNDPELSDPAGDTFDEFLGEPATGPGTENVDILAAWFQPLDAERYTVRLRLSDLTSPPAFRSGRNVHNYEIAFDADGQRFEVIAFRDASGQSFGFINVQEYSELRSPNSDDGDASVVFDTELDELQFGLPRRWSVSDGLTVRSFDFTDDTVVSDIAVTTFDGAGDSHGCGCTPLDRAGGGRSFKFGPEAVVVVLDRKAINKHPPNRFSDEDINSDLAAVGQRQPLRYFARNAGSVITLPSGNLGNEGWFAPRSLPATWAAAGPTLDAARNYLGRPTAPAPYEVGPGLGTPDANGDRESLLKKVPDVVPLRATGLSMLQHRDVCAVVVDGNVGITFGPVEADLRGKNLGTVAFHVIALTGQSGSDLPWMDVEILDTADVCEQAKLVLLPEAPEPASATEPQDTQPPAADSTNPRRATGADPRVSRYVPPWVCVQAPETPFKCA